MTSRVLMAAIAALLTLPLMATAQEQTIKLTLKVEPYLELKDTSIQFTGFSESPGVFDSGWQVVALANSPWRASVLLQPVTVARGPALATSYKIMVRYNGKARVIDVSERDRQRGAISISAGETPHNGVVEMRFIANVSPGDAAGVMLAPPVGIGLTMSTAAF